MFSAISRYSIVIGVTLGALASAADSQAQPVDLSAWVVEDYDPAGGGGASDWVVSGPGNTVVTQTRNSTASIFRKHLKAEL